MPRRQLVGQCAGAVRRAVVDDHQLAVDAVRGERREDRLDQLAEAGALVVGGDDDGEPHAQNYSPTILGAVTAEPAAAAPGRPSPSRRWVAWLAIAVLAALLRGLFPTADPPWRTTVGVVWHDEGAWTHNARNRALLGTWRTDDWNPMYVAPVFTGLEYARLRARSASARWQARLVPMTLGVIAVVAARLGVAPRSADGGAGLAAGVLLATNYVYVMYDRAAIMEGADGRVHRRRAGGRFVKAQDRPAWGARRPASRPSLAYFTKAAAVFFVGALGLDARSSAIALPGAGPRDRRRAARPVDARRPRRRRPRRARALRRPALDRVPLLQLADVGDAQAVLRPAVAAESRVVVPGPARRLRAMWFVVALGLAAFVARALRLVPAAAGRAAARALGRRRRRSSCCCTTSATSAASCS